MLIITIPSIEFYDEVAEEFKDFPETVVKLEHSLFSLSKWESKWEKPFLGPNAKNEEETRSYVQCMSLDPELSSEVFGNLTNENLNQINGYIDSKVSATWFKEDDKGPKDKKVITSELIYYWMIQHTIPFECEHWHLNRLFTLIKVCNEEQSQDQKKKMSKGELAQRNRELNAKRKAEMQTRG